jgi:hypothetical protein
MRVKYRFFDYFSEKDAARLEKIGVKVDGGREPVLGGNKSDAFVLRDDDERFEAVKAFFGRNWRKNVSFIEPDFTETERLSSPWLGVRATKMLGYPQPEDWYDDDLDEDISPPDLAYDRHAYLWNVFEVAASSECGVLKGRQTGFLSIAGEPKWGRSSIGALHWLEDILFVTAELYGEVFEPLGIECRKVLGYGNGKPLETVVQLVPQGIAESKLILNETNVRIRDHVPEWDLERYRLADACFFPSFESDPGGYYFFETQELFGAGSGQTYRENVISLKLYRLLKEHGVKGMDYYPQEKTAGHGFTMSDGLHLKA